MNDTSSHPHLRRRPLLVSFSGLDGSGKTTQINNLREVIARFGLRDQLLAFWDDVVVGTRYREGFVHKVYGSEKGIGEPDKPVNRKDKNVRAWYLTIARHALYLLDAINLRRVIASARRGGADVIVVDRYIYDEMANLPVDKAVSRAFIRLLNFIVPTPDVPYLLDADPEAARARKPEYPVDFLHQSRRSYFRLSRLLGTMTVIPPLPLSDAKREVERAFISKLSETNSPRHREFDTAPAA